MNPKLNQPAGAHIRRVGVRVCNTPSSLENCKKSAQNSLKIVEKGGPVSQSRDVYYTSFIKNRNYIQWKCTHSLLLCDFPPTTGCLRTFLINKPRMLPR